MDKNETKNETSTKETLLKVEVPIQKEEIKPAKKEKEQVINGVKLEDLISYAESIGYNHRGANEILIRDGVQPKVAGKLKRKYKYLSVLENEYDWSADSVKIVIGYMKKEKLDFIVLVNE